MPQTVVVFLVGTLSLAGIPLFAGFFSKEEILGAVWGGGLAVPFAMLVVAAFLTAFYMFRVVFLAFLGRPARGATPAPGGTTAHPHDAPPAMSLPLWLLAILSVAIGIFFVRHHPEPEFAAPGWLTPLAVAVAVGGIAAGLADLSGAGGQRRGPRRAPSRPSAAPPSRASGSTTSSSASTAAPCSASPRGRLDRPLPRGRHPQRLLSAWTLTRGDRLRRIQSGLPQDYVYGVAVGLLLLLIWVQWPR